MPAFVLDGGGACFCGLGLLAAGLCYRQRQRVCTVGSNAKVKTDEMWERLSGHHGTVVTREEAADFFGKKFGKLSVDAMFSQVFTEDSDTMTKQNWDSFWDHVKACGYKDAQIIEEVDNMLKGQAWVDWRDGRNPAQPSRAASRSCSHHALE